MVQTSWERVGGYDRDVIYFWRRPREPRSNHDFMKIVQLLVLVRGWLMLQALMLAVGSHAASAEPDIAVAKTWWPDQRNVWTPIGWKDHYFRFNVVYNGTVLFQPCSDWTSRKHAPKWKAENFQLTFSLDPSGVPSPLPKETTPIWRLDGGHGLQGWRTNLDAPVLWTDFPLQEGFVIRQEVFAHVKGGGEVTTALEPIYAWVRLSVTHVDALRAPTNYPMAVRLSRVYYRHVSHYLNEDGVTVDADPARAAYDRNLRVETSGGRLSVLEPDGLIRLAVLPGVGSAVTFTNCDGGDYSLKLNLSAVVGATVDLLMPALPLRPDEINRELALGFEGALKESDAFWKQRPASVARFELPEDEINQAVRRNIQFAQVVAEKDYVNGDYAQLSGSWGYDQLWSTPTSMNNHMFLSLLGYHDLVAHYSELFRAHQGTVKPPGPSYEKHPGYFSTPSHLTSLDWLSDHGAILMQVSTAALLSGDSKFAQEWTEPVVKACEFIKDACAQTNYTGVKGLLPPAVATDDLIPMQAVWNMAWNYRGLVTAVRFLQSIHHPRAAEFADFAKTFKTTFDREYRELSKSSPKWTDAQGLQRLKPPTTLTQAPGHIFTDAFYLDTGPMVLVWGGLLDAGDELMRDSLEFFRNGPNQMLYGTRYNPLCRPILTHEISSCEPCYSWNVFHSWQLGDRQHFLEGLYSLLVGSLSQNTYISCEHRHGMQGNLFSTGTAFTLARLAMLDDQIKPGDLHLLRLVPSAWVSSEKETILENMPTEYGPITLRFKKSADGKALNLLFRGEWRHKPKKVVLHLPPQLGLETVRINGRPSVAQAEIEIGQ
jgi:hypothetical protein